MTPPSTVELSALTQRIQQLEDKTAISELKYRYLNACDEKQPEQVSACFAAGNIDINFGHIGQFNRREDFIALYTEMACHDHIVDMHHAQNPIITLTDNNHAKAKICLRFQSINTADKTQLQLGGHYLDEFRKENDQWLIIKSHFFVNSVAISDFSNTHHLVTYTGNTMPS
jgi:hypothetical protein